MDFWEDVMDLEADEIVHKLEQWACVVTHQTGLVQ